jgi:hypothetical protein
VTANGVETDFLVFSEGKSRDRNGPAHAHLRRGLRNCGVPEVADLAMLFVGGVLMPVPSGLCGKDAHAKNEGQSQQSYGYSLRHCETHGTPPTMIPLMLLRT